MLKVVLATLPAAIVMTYFFGYDVLKNIALACLFACLAEAVFVYLRGQSIKKALSDYSALLTGLLIGLSIPPALSAGLIVLAVVFAIILVKQLYGGLGQNIFNPAMMGYVVLLVSFPADMSSWPALDGVSGATVLDNYKQGLIQPDVIQKMSAFDISGFVWINIAFLLGGLYLLFARVITWHIPVCLLLGMFCFSGILYVIDTDYFMSPIQHLFSGATMMAAFFIATDPVSAATSRKGQWVYGCMIGLLIIVLRQWSVYPDGVAFAVLLMNMMVPVIDHFTRPRITEPEPNKKQGES